jgi:hypothetical protein
MRTRVELIGNGSSAWNLRGLWISLSCLLKHGEQDRRVAIPEGRERSRVSPAIALRQTVSLSLEKQWLSPTRICRGGVLKAKSGRHLWLALRSEVHRRGALWETAGFLAIWLSGLIAVAICFLS